MSNRWASPPRPPRCRPFTPPFTLQIDVERRKSEELIAKARAALDLDKERKLADQIQKCKVVAPVDGRVVLGKGGGMPPNMVSRVEEGASVRERQRLFSIVAVDGPFRVTTRFSASQFLLIKPGARVQVKPRAKDARPVEGVVKSVDSYIVNDVDPSDRSLAVVIDLSKPTDNLRSGMVADVSIESVSSDPGPVIVPTSAIVARDVRKFVAIKGAGDAIDWREVSTLPQGVKSDHILTGFRVGDVILLKPPEAGPPPARP